MDLEAIALRNKGIELQTEIEEGQAKVRNIDNFTAETETVIEDSQKEVVKYKQQIEVQKEEERKKKEALAERMKIKRMMTRKKEKNKRQSEVLREEKAEEEKKTMLDTQVLLAATEIEEMFQ